jgi:hypothetical protein
MQKCVSVVIPTIGENSLLDTLSFLNESSDLILEVIIVIPDSYKANMADFVLYENNKLHVTKSKGQVKQRIEGFKLINVNTKYILQLDTDILISRATLVNLLATIKKLPKKSCIAPLIVDRGQQSNYMYINSIFSPLFYKILGTNTFKPGVLTRDGINTCFIGLNTISIVDWLPGGCLLHNSSNLILDNYYPFSGKAYAEDVIHSLKLRNNGISLYIDPASIVETKLFNVNVGVINKLKQSFKSFKTQYSLSKKYFKPSLFRYLTIYFLYYVLR